MKFEFDRLIDYDDDEILAELKRVAAIAPEGTFSRRMFERNCSPLLKILLDTVTGGSMHGEAWITQPFFAFLATT